MGAGVSMIQKVGSPTQLLTDQLYASMQKNIKNFDEFHIAFLEVLNKFNAAMPGVHYDVPARAEVEKCYQKWNEEKNQKIREDLLTELLKKSNIISKTDTALLLTGVAAPPVAMIGKRAAGNFPTLSFVKLVPDVLFVPSVTLLAVGCMKYARKNKLPEAAETAKEQSSSADAQKNKLPEAAVPAKEQSSSVDAQKNKLPEAAVPAKEQSSSADAQKP